MELKDKVVIVTGGAGNLGSACARELARQGAIVVGLGAGPCDLSGIDDVGRSGRLVHGCTMPSLLPTLQSNGSAG